MFHHQIVLLVVTLVTYAKPETCQKSLSISVEECTNPRISNAIPSTNCTTPSSDNACQRVFNFTIIDKAPYHKLLPYLMQRILRGCCGDCVKSNIINTFPNITSFRKAIEDKKFENTRIAFPLLHRPTADPLLYNHYFLPMITIDGGVLFTREWDIHSTVILLLKSNLNLWPLLLITILMAVVAGFLGWIMDTWKNEEDFARPFLKGVFDGFWWSFISMTTVGYGDKNAKSTTTRIFAVIWILLGITVFSMLTASMTSAMNDAMMPKEATFIGNKIGVLSDRAFELSFIVKEGGIPAVSNTIEELISKLQNKEIESFLLDKPTASHYQDYLTNLSRTYKQYDGDKIAYGVLAFEKSDFDYFSPILTLNSVILEACTLSLLGTKKMKVSEAMDVLSVNGGLFLPACVFLGSAIALILLFGFFYEIIRRKKLKAPITPGDNPGNDIRMDTEYDFISDLEAVTKRWKGKWPQTKHSTQEQYKKTF